ncbi:PhzF family phenazine biosynthesis protein [Carnobacterium maltaromaticum]|uniref:PhzF family phenazine biosynthesis protein n=1 Tax=Carnobacterium maltaromaticum TaxID=2751 RepID=UPI00026C844D|nr:PhzF family phenazine biosynthesis protein [Carnobacterium maltaromaticum]
MNTLYEVSSFTVAGEGGNLAGVKLLKEDENLSTNEMQVIAKALNYSETAFVKPLNKSEFQLRYFTLLAEVPLCGHATIAAFSLMSQLNQLDIGKYIMHTKAGRLSISVLAEATIFMEQSLPIFYDKKPDRDLLAHSLGVETSDIPGDYPIEIVSTGLKDLIIPVKNTTILQNLKPNMNKIREISDQLDIIGYHVFALDDENQYLIHCRNFAPLVGIDEEYATGTSNGALACYLFKYDTLQGNVEYTFSQGRQSIQQKGKVLVELKATGATIEQVFVGGQAVVKRSLDNL